jgi:hypothetical protein
LVALLDAPELIAKELAEGLPPDYDFLSATFTFKNEKYCLSFKISSPRNEDAETFSLLDGRLLVGVVHSSSDVSKADALGDSLVNAGLLSQL